MNSPRFVFKIMVSTALQPPTMSPIPRSLFGVDHKLALRARRDRKAVGTAEVTRRKQNEGLRHRGMARVRIRAREVALEAGPQGIRRCGVGPGTRRLQDGGRGGLGGQGPAAGTTRASRSAV